MPATYSMIRSNHIGRPISDIKSNVIMPGLEELIGDAIEHVKVQVREVQDREGRWYALRIHPYRTADNKIHYAKEWIDNNLSLLGEKANEFSN